MTITRRDFLSASAALAVVPALGTGAWGAPLPREADIVVIGAGAAGIAAARRIMDANRKVIVIEATGQIGGRCLTDSTTFDVPFDRGARWMHNPDTNPMIKLGRSVGLDVYPAPPRQKIRVGRRFARAGETEEFLAALVRANRAIDDASRGKVDVSCASALPKDLGDWAGTAEFVLGANATGKDLKDLSVVDKVRAQERTAAIACRQGLGTLIAKLGEQVPLALSTPASRVAWSGREVTVETPAGKIAARAAIITVSSNVLAAGNIKFTPGHSQAPARCRSKTEPWQLRSHRAAIAGQSAWAGARRHRHRAKQFDADGAAVCQYGVVVAVFDRCRRLVRTRSLRPGRAGDGGVRGGVADQIVRQRICGCGQEIQRDALECRAVCAGCDVRRRARRAAVAQGLGGAGRLHVPGRRSDPRNPVGNGGRSLGKRRARRGGGIAKDRRAQGSVGDSARGKTPAPRRADPVRNAESAGELNSGMMRSS